MTGRTESDRPIQSTVHEGEGNRESVGNEESQTISTQDGTGDQWYLATPGGGVGEGGASTADATTHNSGTLKPLNPWTL